MVWGLLFQPHGAQFLIPILPLMISQDFPKANLKHVRKLSSEKSRHLCFFSKNSRRNKLPSSNNSDENEYF